MADPVVASIVGQRLGHAAGGGHDLDLHAAARADGIVGVKSGFTDAGRRVRRRGGGPPRARSSDAAARRRHRADRARRLAAGRPARSGPGQRGAAAHRDRRPCCAAALVAAHVADGGPTVAARADASVSMLTWPGVTSTRVFHPGHRLSGQARRGARVGTVVVTLGTQRAVVPVRLTRDVPQRLAAPAPLLTSPRSLTAVRARAPASSANLGPGFDTLAVARRPLRQRGGRAGRRVAGAHRGRGCGALRRRLAPGGARGRRGARARPLRRDGALADPRGPRARLLGRPGGRRRRRRRGRRPLRRRRGLRRAPRERRRQRLRRARGGHVGGRRARRTPRLPLADDARVRRHRPGSEPGHARGARRAARAAQPARTPSSTSGAWACCVAGLADPARSGARGHRGPDPPAGADGALPRGARAARRRWSTPARWRPAGRVPGRRSSASCTADTVEAVRAGAGAALAAAGMEGRVLSLRPDRRGLVYGEEAEVPLEGRS